MLLATDLDGTFLGGKSLHKQQLYRLIRNTTGFQLVFVTGRGLETVIPLLNDPIIPNPDFIICDVGATIVNGYTLEPVAALQKEIESRWPGVLKVKQALNGIEGIEHQEVPQQRRCSYFATDVKIVLEAKERAEKIGCDVIFSADKFMDVLPKAVNKGSTLVKLVKYLNIKSEDVLVAGDTLNDLEMFFCGYQGVVVGNAEKKLINATQNNELIYHAETAGTGGIMEAFMHFDQFNSLKAVIENPVELKESNHEQQIVMMYHRFPYERKVINGKTELTAPKSPNGILPTLKSFFENGRSGVWIAWEEVANSGDILRNMYIDQVNYPNLMASRIGLTKNEVDIFYKLFSKEAFWPTIFSFIDKVKFNHHHWYQYVHINRLFAEKAAEQADTGAIIWIHDYNLWLAPGFLRQLRPDVKIGFFHHTAFPAANTFNILPWRREIIGSLLQCDYIGFHIPRYVENFMDVAKSLYPIREVEQINCAPKFRTYSTALGVAKMTSVFDTGQRRIKIGANPVGINFKYIHELLEQKNTRENITKLKKQFSGKTVILSVERLDYVKGPLEKVLAFEKFLDEYKEFHGKTELINICTPPAQGMKVYQKIQHDVEHAIGRINGKYARVDWVPIRLFFRSFPFEEVLTYYAVADVAWITPLRDGLNLVAKEYIAVQGAQKNANGVLVLSEFAGAAVELPYVITTNPYDPLSLRESLLQALTLSEEEKQMRMKRQYDHVQYYDIDFWADDFLSQLVEKGKLSGLSGEVNPAEEKYNMYLPG
ncbi:MAG: glucosylglycerol-phosphate synthase [Bacteroidetes bacterium]|nr:glucosylglycerol-phosphate synthase [Bacteroidota bacterium]